MVVTAAGAREQGGGMVHRLLIALAVSALGYGASFASSVVVARMLGVEGKGTFSLFATSVAGLSVFAGLGIGQGQMFHAARAPEKLRYFMAHGLVLSLGLGGGAAVLYFLGGLFGGLPVVSALGPVGAAAGLLAVPLFSLLTFQRQYFLTIGRFVAAKANGALALAAPLIACAALPALGIQLQVTSLIVAVVVIHALWVLLFQGWIASASAGMSRSASFSASYLHESVSFGVRQYVSELAQFLTGRLDFFVVAWLAGSTGLGIYSVGVALAEIVSRLARELGTMLFPAFASGTLVNREAPAILRTTLGAAGVIAVVLAAAADPLVRLLFGEDFRGAVPVFRVLLAGTVAWSAAEILWNYVSAAGRPGFGVVVFGVAAAIDTILNLVLIPTLGVLGAGIAATVSYCLAATLLLPPFLRREEASLGEALVVRPSDLRRLVARLAELPGRLQGGGRSPGPSK